LRKSRGLKRRSTWPRWPRKPPPPRVTSSPASEEEKRGNLGQKSAELTVVSALLHYGKASPSPYLSRLHCEEASSFSERGSFKRVGRKISPLGRRGMQKTNCRITLKGSRERRRRRRRRVNNLERPVAPSRRRRRRRRPRPRDARGETSLCSHGRAAAHFLCSVVLLLLRRRRGEKYGVSEWVNLVYLGRGKKDSISLQLTDHPTKKFYLLLFGG